MPQPSLEPARVPREQAVQLSLEVTDPDAVAALLAHPEGRRRDEFARAALRIGILAIKSAEGRIDGETVRAEGERLVALMEARLADHQTRASTHLTALLKDYFDPESGRFNERVKRLVEKDGELERLLRSQVGKEDSELAKALASHFGEQSPLMRVLSPDASKGLLAQLAVAVEQALGQQREKILGEFSLDNKDGALARLVGELTTRHGKLGEDLAGRIEIVAKEFSLDNADGALSRLVGRVEKAQAQISSEFSLDEQGSALARLRKELVGVLETQNAAAQKFQEEVKTTLASLQARKAEAKRSTTHGRDFEAALGDVLRPLCQAAGDVLEEVSATTGLIRASKVGDFVITLGKDCRAPGARIVVEAKESGSYDLAGALAELETARKNRGCDIGVFAWSRHSAPAGQSPLQRHGDDVVIVWDAESEASDVVLHAGLSLARALCTKAAVQRERQSADLTSLDKAIREVERQATGLDEIQRFGETIKGGAEKILDRVRIVQVGLRKQVEALDAVAGDLKAGG